MRKRLTLFILIISTIILGCFYPPIQGKSETKRKITFEQEIKAKSAIFQKSHQLDLQADSLKRKLEK